MSDYYILKDGEPAQVKDVITWGHWFQNADDQRRIAVDEIGDVRISTVFLGLDHGWNGGPPILFETMIFGGDHDGYQERYATRTEALEGHARAVVLVKQTDWPISPDS
jgi:hypothetical protein